MTVETYLWS